MSVLLIILVFLVIAGCFYIYINAGIIILSLSLILIVLVLVIEQIFKKFGSSIDIFKTEKKDIKILDETSLIDGRIVDIINSGFVSGTVVVPKFLVEKLQRMSNSDSDIERSKGRRALDIIARLGESEKIQFKISNTDFKENDIVKKIFMLAKIMKASVITTDFQMTKNGAIENIKVLNISDLSLALKTVILPGEDISIFVMKEGKEKNQGIGYLDDGTMVVVEDGYQYIGKKVDVRVQSILQTSNGKIIFTKIKFNDK